VGRRVSRELDAPFLDVDAAIEESVGRSIRDIFEQDGEPAFREMERYAVSTALDGEPCVIAAGGGWAAEGDNLGDAESQAVLIHLETTPREAAARVGGQSDRPLMNGHDAEPRMEELWAARRSFYERAHHAVPTDGRAVERVAADVIALARSSAGW
jgi:shikimate kinase